jgi:isoleucyl-tRNA synthetase
VENKEKFDRDFPADFIAEGIDQTRGWFYSLLVLSTALEDKSSYKNVVVNGTILAEDGQKMSKSLRNYPDPMHIVHRYGADSMRFYLMGSPAVRADDLRFSESGVDEVLKKLVLTLWNSYSFFITYASLDNFKPKGKLSDENVLDKWIISKTNNLIKNITDAMDKYDLSLSARELTLFIDELSNWYIRRSRKRFWRSENDIDKISAYETLNYVLINYVKLLAPFMPFVSEEIYKNLTEEESVHLSSWPESDKKMIHNELEKNMEMIRKAVELGLSRRAENGIKVRQPLSKMIVKMSAEPKQNLLDIVAEEVNVKEVMLERAKELSIDIDTKITSELEKEGFAREFVRTIQSMRKKADFNVEDRIEIFYETDNKKLIEAINDFKDTFYSIKKETLAKDIIQEKQETEYSETSKVNGIEVWIGLKRASK